MFNTVILGKAIEEDNKKCFYLIYVKTTKCCVWNDTYTAVSVTLR